MNPQRNLSRESFDFLVYEHQFQYEGFQQGWIAYSSEKMVVRVFEGRATPSLVLRVQSEPSFTEIQLGTVMESLGRLTRDQYEKRMDGHNVEENFAFIKSLFREFQYILLYQPELWWLGAQQLLIFENCMSQK
jgi:hypothetical protein